MAYSLPANQFYRVHREKVKVNISKIIIRDVNFLFIYTPCILLKHVDIFHCWKYTQLFCSKYSAQNVLLKMFAQNVLLKMICSKCSPQNVRHIIFFSNCSATFWEHFEENILGRTNSPGPFEQIILSRTFRAKYLSLIVAKEIVNVFQ